MKISFKILAFAIFTFFSSIGQGAEVIKQKKCVVLINDFDGEKGAKVILVKESGDFVPARVVKKRSGGVVAKVTKNCKKNWIGSSVEPEGEELDRDSSEFKRKDLNFDLGLEMGMVVAPAFSVGVIGSFYFNPYNTVELTYSQGEFDVLIFKVETSIAELRYKRFWGNSFYTNIGPGLRSISATSPLADALAGEEVFKGEVQSLVLGIAIGNKWQWDSFFIGCDWIGAHVPLTNLSTSVTEATEEQSEETQTSIEDKRKDWEKIGEVTTTQLLRFYLGFAF